MPPKKREHTSFYKVRSLISYSLMNTLSALNVPRRFHHSGAKSNRYNVVAL